MFKKIMISSILTFSFSLFLSGCNDLEGKYYKVVEFEPTKNVIIIEYESDKIAPGYFIDKVNDYCKKRNRVFSLNSIKNVSNHREKASFSCIIDD